MSVSHPLTKHRSKQRPPLVPPPGRADHTRRFSAGHRAPGAAEEVWTDARMATPNLDWGAMAKKLPTGNTDSDRRKRAKIFEKLDPNGAPAIPLEQEALGAAH